MFSRSKHRHVDVSGIRLHLANAFVDLVELSEAGVVVWVSYPLPPLSEWPLVLEFPGGGAVRVAGRVLLSEEAAAVIPSAALEGHYLLALAFVDPPEELQRKIARMSGAGTRRDPC
jgi:hypothetical protein